MKGLRAAVLLLLLVLALPAAAQRPEVLRDRFDVDPAHSHVGFSVGFMGLTQVEGRFTRYFGTILFNEQDPTQSIVNVAIRANSIYTANDFRDNHLKSPDFFDAEKHPLLLFESTRIEKRGTEYLLTGNLTMRGVTKEVAIPVRMLHGRMKDMWQNSRIGFEGKLKIDRRDFGIVTPPRWEGVLDGGRLTIGNEVEIALNIQGRIFNYDLISLAPKHVAAELQKTLETGGAAAAVARYRELKETRAGDFEWNENGLNTLGYKLLHQGRTNDAIEIFKLNAEMFPKSGDLLDSLAEGYAVAGNTPQAIETYKKALELDPLLPNPKAMLRYLAAR